MALWAFQDGRINIRMRCRVDPIGKPKAMISEALATIRKAAAGTLLA